MVPVAEGFRRGVVGPAPRGNLGSSGGPAGLRASADLGSRDAGVENLNRAGGFRLGPSR